MKPLSLNDYAAALSNHPFCGIARFRWRPGLHTEEIREAAVFMERLSRHRAKADANSSDGYLDYATRAKFRR